MKIFGPAVAGTVMQLIAVGLMTVLFYLLARARYFSLGWPRAVRDEESGCRATASLVRLSYLTTAVGVALTDNRLITRTTFGARRQTLKSSGEKGNALLLHAKWAYRCR
ncbi:MAG TPA: hypothetical protein VN723_10715 [Rhizomicrobium sp.]|jgi:hypothetical protein|nr:hypothetical protein [Rhizomicrobium sp.]